MTNSCSPQPPKTSANWPRSFLHRSKHEKPDRKGARALNPAPLSAPATRCFSTESARTCRSLHTVQMSANSRCQICCEPGCRTAVTSSPPPCGSNSQLRPSGRVARTARHYGVELLQHDAQVSYLQLPGQCICSESSWSTFSNHSPIRSSVTPAFLQLVTKPSTSSSSEASL